MAHGTYYCACIDELGFFAGQDSGIGRPLGRGDGFPVGQKSIFLLNLRHAARRANRGRGFFSIMLLAHGAKLLWICPSIFFWALLPSK